MSHLNEKLAEFFYGELTAAEMAPARRHVSECAQCREELEQFERTHHALRALPDVEPPRQIVFEIEKRPYAAGWLTRWLLPTAASAAVALAVVMLAPALNRQAAPEPVVAEQISSEPLVQPIDYERVIREVRDSQQTWLLDELRKRDLAQTKEIQRLRGELAYLEGLQRNVWKETIENSSSIQLLAQKTASQD